MTVGMPDWAAAIPSTAGVHPSRAAGWSRPDTGGMNLLQLVVEAVERFLKEVVLAVVGVFIPGRAAFEQLQEWGGDLAAALAKIPIIGDIIEILTGKEDGDLNDLGTWVHNLLGNLWKALTSPLVWVSHISATSPNLLANPNFSDANALSGLTDWAFDPGEDHDGDGSGSAKALGHNVFLLSNEIAVVAGHKFDIGAWTQYSGVTATAAANSIRVSVIGYLNGAQVTASMVAGVASPSGTADWTHLSGSYTVPAGVDTVRVQLGVTADMSAGTVWFDTINAHKTGNMPGNLVQGITGAVSTIVQDVQGVLNNIVAGLLGFGNTLYDAVIGDANTVTYNLNDTIAAMQAAISTLQNSASYVANAGNSDFVSWASAADASSLGAAWSQTYGGTGTGVLGIVSGRAAWKDFSDNSRSCVAVYTAKQTTTDYQKIGVAFASAPNDWYGGNDALNYIGGRVNAAGSTYVYVMLGPDTCELGCTVAGTTTVFGSVPGFKFKSGASYWLECGTVGGVNIFKVWENDRVIKTYTDSGHVSAYGADYRYVGVGSSYFGSSLLHTTPGAMAAFAFSDNTPAPVLGSGFRRYRSSGTGVSQASGVHLLASNFFDTAERITTDLTYDGGSNNKLTMSVAGWYLVKVQLALSDWIHGGQSIQALLYKNGAVVAAGAETFGTAALGAATGGGSNFGGTFIVYCDPGDYVQIGCNASTSLTVTGGPSGTQCHFEAVFVNNTVPR